jgi:hypothetical protein
MAEGLDKNNLTEIKKGSSDGNALLLGSEKRSIILHFLT